MAEQLFGGDSPAGTGETRNVTMASDVQHPRSAAEAARLLDQTLARFQTLLESQDGGRAQALDAPASDELRLGLQEVLRRIEDAVAHLSSEARRLSAGATDLAGAAGRVGEQMGGLTAALDRALSDDADAAPATEPAPLIEPSFQPGERPVRIVLASVPGFQELMEVQRTLSNMTAAAGASVVGFKNGLASLDVPINAAVTVREIVDGLHRSTGHPLLIEEARPEERRLRLRFVDGNGRS